MVKRTRKGQALVMITLALFAMVGLVGLAVDLGWSYFVRRSAQRAADMAALAGANQVIAAVGQGGTFGCGGPLGCQTKTACIASPPTPPASSVDTACLYAKQNGFHTTGNNNRQVVFVEAAVTAPGCDTASPPNCIPTAAGVAAYYYLTVTVVETVPQLFSSILGNTVATVAARASAGVLDSITIGSLILLNREGDASPVTGRGVNLDGQGGSEIQVPGGILMASQCNGGNCDGRYAGRLQGGQSLTSPFTYIRGVGRACAGNLGCQSQSTWIAPPINNKPLDDPMFLDPMRGKGQPPLDSQEGPAIAMAATIPGGTAANPVILSPGRYFMTTTDRFGNVVATGQPISLGAGHFRFGSCGSSFPQWTFYGGLRTSSGNAVVTFTPGRYVFAGQNGREGDPMFEISNGTILQDCTSAPGPNTDAGQLFIFTDANYPGMESQVPGPVVPIRDTLGFGVAGITTGNNDNSAISLHGLNDGSSNIPAELEPFSPAIWWQDQRNSRVKHQSDGNVDITSCGSATIENPCTNFPEDSLNREMFLRATPSVQIYGAAYQPRGAWLNMQAGGSYTGPLQIVTGAVRLQGAPPLNLSSISNPITRRVAALVE